MKMAFLKQHRTKWTLSLFCSRELRKKKMANGSTTTMTFVSISWLFFHNRKKKSIHFSFYSLQCSAHMKNWKHVFRPFVHFVISGVHVHFLWMRLCYVLCVTHILNPFHIYELQIKIEILKNNQVE